MNTPCRHGAWILLLACSLFCGKANGAAPMVPSSVPRDDFWVPDGPVNAVVETNGIIYIGGVFDYISQVSETGRAFDRFSGATITEFPTFAGAIKAILNDNAGGWFVGGQFTAVGGYSISNLAHIRSDMSVDASWAPNPDGGVLALASDGTNLFVGGTFANISGEAHSLLAALDLATGANHSWRADCTTTFPNPSVNALAVSGGRLYIGGYYSFINGRPREHVGSVDAVTGAVTDWYPNGYTGSEAGARVDALAIAGNTLYVGGTFASIGGQQTNGPLRHFIAALDVTRTNFSVMPWNPNANGPVTAIVVGCDTVYIAGAFTSVGGQPRNHLAALDASTGQPLPWNPDADGDVLSLALAGNVVYAGGKFSQVGGRPRNFLAALDAITGDATFWNPKADFGVAGLTVSGGVVISGGVLGPGGKLRRNAAAFNARTGRPLDWAPRITGDTSISGAPAEGVYAITASKSTVYLGGPFTTVDGQPRQHLAAVDALTGALKPWNPGAQGIVQALALSRNVVYVGGLFTSAGGANRTNIAALDATTGVATGWNPGANGKITAIKRQGSTVYVGGLFKEIGGQLRGRLAALNGGTGKASRWNPNASDSVSSLALLRSRLYVGGVFSFVGGQPRHYAAAVGLASSTPVCWDPDAQFFAPTGERAAAVNAIATSADTVYVAGSFNHIAGQPRNRLAALSANCPASATAWDPSVDDSVNALAITRSTVFAAGVFKSIGGRYRPNFAAFPPVGAPGIARQPRSQFVAIGDSVLLEAAAEGQAPLSYQWQFNGTNIVGATNPTLALHDVRAPNAGDYVLVVTNKLGLVNSRPAAVSVLEPLSIAAEPQSQAVAPGTAVTLNVVALGQPPPIYQWRLNGVNIPGAVNPTYTLTNAAPQDGGSYDVVVANSTGAMLSDVATVVVTSPVLVFSDHYPSNLVFLAGDSGVGSGSNVGATSDPGEPNHAGKAGGSSVWVSWIATGSGVAVFNTRGSTFDTLLGIYTLSNGVPVEVVSDEDAGGFQTSQAAFNTEAGANYLIAIDGFDGATGHLVLTWTFEAGVPEIPRFITQPFDQSVTVGTNVTFSSFAVSAVAYQWFKNCDAIPGATNATLTLSNVTFDDVGNYRVVAVNASLRVTESVTASLEIGPVPSAFSHDKLEDLLAAAANEESSEAKQLSKALRPTAFVSVAAGAVASQTLNNTRAGTQSREPLICGTLGGASKWFGLRARTSGTLVIDTIGSRIDTLLSAYRRTTLRSLSTNLLACDDNSAPDGLRSVVRFDVTNGQDILVSIDGANGQQGRVVLNWKLTNQTVTLKDASGVPPPPRTIPPNRFVDAPAISVEPRFMAGKLRVSIAGTDHERLVLQSSTNLIQWTPIHTNPPQSPPVVFEFPMSGTGQRFFRAVR